MHVSTEPTNPPATQPVVLESRVLAHRQLSSTSFELTLERLGLPFHAGQLINLHGRNHLEDRSYTVCAGEQDEALVILYRMIPSGLLTPQLARLCPGDRQILSGPYGEFTVRDPTRPVVFFATGTGIAPARAYQRSHPALELHLVHGVRETADLYYRDDWRTIASYQPCVSGESVTPGIFPGRVTQFARDAVWPDGARYHLCGANEMIYEMTDLLLARGVAREDIFTEAYYYRADD
jgi:benzoate/toluate 1,2-dioxygenase reductase subunit